MKVTWVLPDESTQVTTITDPTLLLQLLSFANCITVNGVSYQLDELELMIDGEYVSTAVLLR